MKLEEAQVLAERVASKIRHLCDKIEVVGSIRRQRPDINDIDIVLIPQHWMWNTIADRLKHNMDARILKAGQELVTLNIPTDSTRMQVDLYRARPETWGVLMLIRTGSVQHNIMMCRRAQRMGMMLSAKGGVVKNGEVIASRTEKEIFKTLDMEFVSPEKREV